MALDLTGIDNRGEFYSHHYLDALLERDLKPLLQRWSEQAEGPSRTREPPKALTGLAGRYFDARSAAAELGEHAPGEQLAAAADLHARLLSALGYQRTPALASLDDGTVLPLAHREDRGGQPWLWVMETGFSPTPDSDPLAQPPLLDQLHAVLPKGVAAIDVKLPEGSWRDILDKHVFRQEDPPSWVMVLSGSEVVLSHKHKWGLGKALAFNLDELFSRRQAKAFRAMAGLLHADALCPTDGTPLHEQLDESSHKHAFAVSTDLREGAQQAIEILGNEAVHYLRTVRRRGVFGTSGTAEGIDATQLTRECLIWLYRLIFLFYAESRSEELGVAPMKSEAYRRGYSLESLRALEGVPLLTPAAQEGTYLHTSLTKLFRLLNEGYPSSDQTGLLEGSDAFGFRIPGLHSHLFDDAHTPLLAKVKLRNAALQQVIELLSLSREGKHKARGRISYASLGINQLGAVYEGLLSYTGFFAHTDLIEVVNAKENGKADARTFFVPASDLDLYDDSEIVLAESGARIQHPRGTFLYRLAGRDREKSASYYTPEVLTECLVRYTLRERIGTDPSDANWLSADALLELTVLEPAMGSGAFLNEAVNQLADAWLVRKQAEVVAAGGDPISTDRIPYERQRVRARIAANNLYGVDLNPLAAELGKVSLWLNVLRPGASAPFFDANIRTGNSLIGARQQTYLTSELHKGSKKKPNWLDRAPKDLTGPRPTDAIYHWLLPASGMAAFDSDKVVKALRPEETKVIKAWRKALNTTWKPAELDRLRKLSAVVDDLWTQHSQARIEALASIRQPRPVWPDPEPPATERTDEDTLARRWAELERQNSAGRRLKRAMDYWCAAWFWPVLDAEHLPSREDWLTDLEALLTQPPRVDLETSDDPQAKRFAVVESVLARHRFVHWQWCFPEVFERGGFDVVVGNPPWVKVQWNEGGILGDLDPRLEIRRMSAKQKADERAKTLSEDEALRDYLTEFEELDGTKSFLNSVENYPLLQGVQTNLYKCFITESQRWAPQGTAGIIHQKGMFDDPRGGRLRAAIAPSLRWHLHFINKLILFEGVEDQKHYELTIFDGRSSDTIQFRQISNLFHPKTVHSSLIHDGHGPIPGIKNADNDWDLRGHRSRIVEVDEATLALFAKLYDSEGTPPREARLPVVHSQEILSVLRKFAKAPRKLGDLDGEYFASEHFHETNQQHDSTIRRETRFPEGPEEWVVSGPHFYVGTPFNKTPNEGCRHNQDYTVVDHMTMPADYLPRTNYVPACSPAEYRKRTPEWRGRPVTERYRHVNRKMIPPTGERTLASSIIPAGPGHIHGVFSLTFQSNSELCRYAAMCHSIVADFFVKTTGKSNLMDETLQMIPMAPANNVYESRTLRLNCLTPHYADLWQELWDPAFAADTHTKPDPRLPAWTELGPEWTWSTPLRSPFARRQALVELDALAALALGLTADELCLIYRVQFPVLQQYEADTWYDRRGRIVFTNNRGLNGVGLDRKTWESIRGEAVDASTFAGADVEMPEDALGAYEAPFDRCDREVDMRQAFEVFVGRGVGA